jgi:hypothetical protein
MPVYGTTPYAVGIHVDRQCWLSLFLNVCDCNAVEISLLIFYSLAYPVAIGWLAHQSNDFQACLDSPRNTYEEKTVNGNLDD